MLKDNRITAEEYKRKSKDGNALISYLGMKDLDLIDINIEPFYLYPDDMLLLSSDGLTKIMSENEIENKLRTSTCEAADELIKYVKNAKLSLKDNSTFILIKLKEKN